jgi:hypothetical protein
MAYSRSFPVKNKKEGTLRPRAWGSAARGLMLRRLGRNFPGRLGLCRRLRWGASCWCGSRLPTSRRRSRTRHLQRRVHHLVSWPSQGCDWRRPGCSTRRPAPRRTGRLDLLKNDPLPCRGHHQQRGVSGAGGPSPCGPSSAVRASPNNDNGLEGLATFVQKAPAFAVRRAAGGHCSWVLGMPAEEWLPYDTPPGGLSRRPLIASRPMVTFRWQPPLPSESKLVWWVL